MTDKKASIIAGIMTFILIVASIGTVALFGSGIWFYLTADAYAPLEPLDTQDRWAGVAICAIPIALVVIVWTLITGYTRVVNAQAASSEGEQSSD